MRQLERPYPAPLLVGLVFALDLFWSLSGISSGNLAYGLVDEPAHLATCLVGLLLLVCAGRRLPAAFVAAAAVASVAIDVDHLPKILSWSGLTAGTPRPYSHCALAVAVAAALGLALRGRHRAIFLGVAFGIGAHLLRDLATGPGVALGWPLSTAPVTIPYATYAAALGSAAAAVALGFSSARIGLPGRLRSQATRAWCLAALVVAAGVGAGAAMPARATAAAPHVAVGIYVHGADRDSSRLDQFTSAVGRPPAIVHSYREWYEPPFEPASLETISATGAIPLVTWEPWDSSGNYVSLWDIAAGLQDEYIAESARQAAVWGGPLFVRFAHEMNGSWYPWGRGVGENTPTAFKTAWRHVVEIFRREGAENVRWVWTPYVDAGNLPFRRFYPGDRWVDWAGFDGFNWGRPFMSFAKIFDDSYRKMVKLTSKPLMIAETGSVEAGGSKAVWIRRAMRRALPRLKHVRAVLWWSDVHPDGTDWRIDTSPDALAALASALQAPRFQAGRQLLLSTPGWLRKR